MQYAVCGEPNQHERWEKRDSEKERDVCRGKETQRIAGTPFERYFLRFVGVIGSMVLVSSRRV